MDLKKLLPMSLPEGPPFPVALKIKWPWRKGPISIGIFDKYGKQVSLATGQIVAGESYLLVVSVTNTSTRNGSLSEATEQVSVLVTAGGANIFSVKSPHDFTAGETHEFEYSMNIPSSAGGQSGTISATLLDPNGNVLDQASVNVIVNVVTTTSSLHGTVTDYLTSLPIAGATVYLESGVLQTTTDSNGNYSFPDFVTGTYDLSAVKGGYGPYSGAFVWVAGDNKQDIQLTPITPTGLVIYGKNMPDILWSGSLTDLSNGKVQTWGVQNVNQYVNLQPTAGKQILLQYNLGTAYNYDAQTMGPLLITMSSTSGLFAWDGTSLTLGGVAALNLPATSNRQTLIGTMGSLQNGVISMGVSSVTPNGSNTNVGQYFVGQTVEVYGASVSAALIGRVIMVDCHLGEYDLLGDQTIYVPGFIAYSVKVQRPYPDSAYQFSGSLTNPRSVYRGDICGNCWYNYFELSVYGTVSPFAIMVLGLGASGYDSQIALFSGPVSNATITASITTNMQGDVYRLDVFANPDPNAPATYAPNVDVNGWVPIGSLSLSDFVFDSKDSVAGPGY